MAEFYPAYSGSFYADGKAMRAVEDFRKDFVRNRSTVFSCFRFCEPAIIKEEWFFHPLFRRKILWKGGFSDEI